MVGVSVACRWRVGVRSGWFVGVSLACRCRVGVGSGWVVGVSVSGRAGWLSCRLRVVSGRGGPLACRWRGGRSVAALATLARLVGCRGAAVSPSGPPPLPGDPAGWSAGAEDGLHWTGGRQRGYMYTHIQAERGD